LKRDWASSDDVVAFVALALAAFPEAPCAIGGLSEDEAI